MGYNRSVWQHCARGGTNITANCKPMWDTTGVSGSTANCKPMWDTTGVPGSTTNCKPMWDTTGVSGSTVQEEGQTSLLTASLCGIQQECLAALCKGRDKQMKAGTICCYWISKCMIKEALKNLCRRT